MKILIMVLLITTVTIYGFSEENVSENNYDRIGNSFFEWNLFNNNTEQLTHNSLNHNLFVFNNIFSLGYNSIRNRSLHNINNNLFPNMEYEPIISIEDKRDAFSGAMNLTFLALFWSDSYRNFLRNDYKYFENQWNKTIEEEELMRRIIRNYRR